MHSTMWSKAGALLRSESGTSESLRCDRPARRIQCTPPPPSGTISSVRYESSSKIHLRESLIVLDGEQKCSLPSDVNHRLQVTSEAVTTWTASLGRLAWR